MEMEKKRGNKLKNLCVFLLVICMLLLAIMLFLTRHFIKMEAKLGVIEKIVDNVYLDEIDKDKLEEYIYKGYVAGLEDPYSQYYTKEEFEELNEENTGEYIGIGVVIQKDGNTGQIIFGEPYEGSAAQKAGILSGDIIVKMNGESIEGKSLNDIVSKLKGKKGVVNKFTVLRDGKEIEIEVESTEVEVTTVKYKMLENKIGYIELSQFIEVSAEQFKKAYKNLKKDGATSLIVDVRDNPGGLLSGVIDIADYFLDKNKMIVYTKDKNGKSAEYQSSHEKMIDLPLVLLVNEGSASAAEILTGVVKDHKLGIVIGENTFGKGIVQKFYPLADGSAVKLTVEKYYTPNGSDIHKKGIAPDIEVKDEREDASESDSQKKNEKKEESETDSCLEKAIEVLKNNSK